MFSELHPQADYVYLGIFSGQSLKNLLIIAV